MRDDKRGESKQPKTKFRTQPGSAKGDAEFSLESRNHSRVSAEKSRPDEGRHRVQVEQREKVDCLELAVERGRAADFGAQ